jgi:hypothetical protein
MSEKSLKVAMEASQKFPQQDLIKILLARTYLANGRFENCYSVLKDATILPFEGQRDVHGTFVQCQVAMAMQDMKKGRFSQAIERLDASREFPERLGTGKPGNPDYRLQDSLAMLCYEKMNMPAKANEAWEKVRSYSSRRSQGSADSNRERVGEWYRTSFQTEPELKALEELARTFRTGRRR